MKLPKLLKNINRGIALLVILSIGLAIYVLYDNNRFKKEQPVIGKLLTEFTEQTADMMLLPQEYRVYKKKLPQEVLLKKGEENNKIIDKYWTTETQKNIWFTREIMKSEMQNIFRDFHDKQSYPNGIILSDKIMVKEVKDYQKTSPSTAQATVIYYASFDFFGVPAVFLGQNIVSLDMAYSGSADSLKTGEAFNAVFDEVSVTYNLAKTSAGWKISSIKPDYSYPNGTIEPKTENQEGGETDGSSSAN